MIIRTVRFFTTISMQALFYFKVVWMKFLLLPSMTIRTFVFIVTAIFIRGYEAFCVPILAHILLVIKNVRLSSVILPIMCIDANISFMIIFSIRTPYCLKMKQVKIHVWFKFFNKLD